MLRLDLGTVGFLGELLDDRPLWPHSSERGREREEASLWQGAGPPRIRPIHSWVLGEPIPSQPAGAGGVRQLQGTAGDGGS